MSAPGDRAQTAKGPKGNRLGFAPERSGVGTCFQQLAGVFACLPRLRQRPLGIGTQRQGFSLPPWRYFKRQYCPPGRPPGRGYFHLQGTAVVDPVDMWPSCKRCRSEACWGHFLGGTGKPGKVPPIAPLVCVASTARLCASLAKKNPAYLWESGVYWSALDVVERQIGGEGGIRTHGSVATTPDFESGTFDHSATSPRLEACDSSSLFSGDSMGPAWSSRGSVIHRHIRLLPEPPAQRLYTELPG